MSFDITGLFSGSIPGLKPYWEYYIYEGVSSWLISSGFL